MSSLRSFRGAILGLTIAIISIFRMAAMSVAQQSNPGNASTQPEDFRQNNPGFLVRADVNRAVRSYREGDSLSVSVASEADAYVYVLYKQADGKVFQIYPNARQPHNRVRARQAVVIPAGDDLFRWMVGPPFGKEILKVLASKEPLDELSDPAFREKLFNPVPQQTLKGIELELGKKEAVWAEDCVEIATYAANDTPQQAGMRRVGLFVGLGKYDHIVQTVTRPDGEKAEIHRPGHRDARLLAGVLEEVGQLHKARIITNEDATRSGVEEAITQWLPAATQPGDTVILYFSGYAVPVLQGQSGEGDRGVVLALYDFITPEIMRTLQKQRSEQKITRAHSQQLTKAEQVASSSGNQAVLREWGIAEDLFAHWLQTLSGRQVIVILDAPNAIAFGPAVNPEPGQAGSLPYGPTHGPMANGVSRLQSLGQGGIALLGACASQRFDVERDPHGLSLMTELLIQSIHRATGPLSLEEAHREVAKNLEARLAEINQRLRAAGKDPVTAYQPYMVNTSTRPVMLKP